MRRAQRDARIFVFVVHSTCMVGWCAYRRCVQGWDRARVRTGEGSRTAIMRSAADLWKIVEWNTGANCDSGAARRERLRGRRSFCRASARTAGRASVFGAVARISRAPARQGAHAWGTRDCTAFLNDLDCIRFRSAATAALRLSSSCWRSRSDATRTCDRPREHPYRKKTRQEEIGLTR